MIRTSNRNREIFQWACGNEEILMARTMRYEIAVNQDKKGGGEVAVHVACA